MSSSELFIPPGSDVGAGHPQLSLFSNLSRTQIRQRWGTPHGQEILRTWEASGFDRQAIERLVGTYYTHLDLRGIPLARRRLARINLSKSDLFHAELAQTDLSQADLSDSYLSEADISGTRLDWAKAQGVLLDSVTYDLKTSFLGVDLHSINFTLAALLEDLAITQQRIQHLQARSPALAWFLRITSQYGLSLPRYFLWVTAIILVFAVLYSVVPGAITKPGLWNGTYFSVVTFTTLGYGDITPASTVGKVLAVVEVCAGYLMGGLLVSILARRVMLG